MSKSFKSKGYIVIENNEPKVFIEGNKLWISAHDAMMIARAYGFDTSRRRVSEYPIVGVEIPAIVHRDETGVWAELDPSRFTI